MDELIEFLRAHYDEAESDIRRAMELGHPFLCAMGSPLADIDAKRKILDEAIRLMRYDGEFQFLELLALPYADKPGYREEWRPVTP